jgi:hypothetical protein
MPITKRMKIKVLEGKLEGQELTAYRSINFNTGRSFHHPDGLKDNQDYIYVVWDEDVQTLTENQVKELKHG